MNGGRRPPMLGPGMRGMPMVPSASGPQPMRGPSYPGMGPGMMRGYPAPPFGRVLPGGMPGGVPTMIPSPAPPAPPPPQQIVTVVDYRRPLSDDGVVDNNRGNSLDLAPPLGTATEEEFGILRTNPQTINSLRNRRCKRGEVLGVTLGIRVKGQDVEPSLAVLHAMVRATIVWGVGSANYQVTCDWLLGTTLALRAEEITKIEAQYLAVTAPWDPTPVGEGDLPTFEVTAGLGYGANSHNSNPARFTELVQLETQVSTRTVPIPDFATSLTVLPVGDSPVVVEMFGYSTVFAVDCHTVVPLSNTQNNAETRIPIPNGARFVRVTNGQITDIPAVAFLVFGLAFG